MSNSITNLKPIKLKVSDGTEAETFVALFLDAQNGLRRVVAFGVYAWEMKMAKLKHGQFLPWVKSVCPVDRDADSFTRCVQGHMNMTKSVLETCKVQIRNAFRICDSGKTLLLPDGKVPDSAKPLRDKIFSIIDGKSARQLFAEFKQADDREGKSAGVKRGRLKGQGGATKEQRLSAGEIKEKGRVLNIQLEAKDFANWILENVGPEGVFKIESEAYAEFWEAYKTGWDFLSKLPPQKQGARA